MITTIALCVITLILSVITAGLLFVGALIIADRLRAHRQRIRDRRNGWQS